MVFCFGFLKKIYEKREPRQSCFTSQDMKVTETKINSWNDLQTLHKEYFVQPGFDNTCIPSVSRYMMGYSQNTGIIF